jgi:hypothetical protein
MGRLAFVSLYYAVLGYSIHSVVVLRVLEGDQKKIDFEEGVVSKKNSVIEIKPTPS